MIIPNNSITIQDVLKIQNNIINHNSNKYGKPAVTGALSMKLVKQRVEAKANNIELPSYLNPIYRGAYYQPKHRR